MDENKNVTANSYDIVADAVRKFWEETYVQDVIAFFYQKYDFDSDNEWIWHEEYIYPQSSYDYETVNFQTDFCEGQTCVKDLVIVSFDDVTSFFTTNHFDKNVYDMISRQAAIDALKEAYWDKDLQSVRNDPGIVDAMTDWSIRQISGLPSYKYKYKYKGDGKYGRKQEDNI